MMKNKKLKLFIVAVLILQILMPAGLLYRHYSVYNDAVTKSPEFKFQLEYLDIYDIHDTGEGEERLHYNVKDIYNRNHYREDVAVTVGDDGFVRMSRAENKTLNKHWFTHRYYSNMIYWNSGDYEYEEGVDRLKLIYKINALYSMDVEKPEGFYVTAKVYKGVFIPTALYIEDQKVITFTQRK